MAKSKKESEENNIQDIEYSDVTDTDTTVESSDDNAANEEEEGSGANDYQPTSADLARVNSAELAKLDAFSNVEQVKLFAIQMGIPGSPESVAQRIVRGRELGVPAMMAMDHIYILNGRATLSVHLVNTLLKRAGYEIKTIRDNKYLYKDGTYGDLVIQNETIGRCCTIQAKWRSKLTGEIETEEYTYWWHEATAAGLTTKTTWKQYGNQLLWNRTLVFLARRIASEALMGMYETSEIADTEGKLYRMDDSGNAIPI